MIFDDPHSRKTKWKPITIQVCRLWWEGKTKTEIQTILDISYPTLQNVLESDQGKFYLAQLEAGTMDAMIETHNYIQSVSIDLAKEKVNLALYSPNEHVRTRNTNDLLQIAGHVPTHRVMIAREDPLMSEMRGKTELDIRKELAEIKRSKSPQIAATEKGPDDKLLN